MSRVTDVILTMSLLEEVGESEQIAAVDSLNAWLSERNLGSLVKVDQMAVTGGGGQSMAARVFIGAFNYLDMEEFQHAVAKAPWRDFETTRLFMKEEPAESFIDATPSTGTRRGRG